MVRKPRNEILPTEDEKKQLIEQASSLSADVKAILVNRLQLLKNTKPMNRGNYVDRRGRPRKRDQGKLKKFIDLPLDAFLEIASYLEPLDLIVLSRVSKEFHAVFMSREARSVWSKVLQDVPGLPKCPLDMTEPQYASLIFERRCHACNSNKARFPQYHLRVRFCGVCQYIKIIRGKSLPRPHWPFSESIFSLLPCNCSRRKTSLENDKWCYYLASEVKLVTEECLALRNDRPALLKYMADRRIAATALMQHGALITCWEELAERDRESKNWVLSNKRKEQILTKMEALGWETKYFPAQRDCFSKTSKDLASWQRYLDKPEELTETAWKTMRPKLEAIYERSKKVIQDKSQQV